MPNRPVENHVTGSACSGLVGQSGGVTSRGQARRPDAWRSAFSLMRAYAGRGGSPGAWCRVIRGP